MSEPKTKAKKIETVVPGILRWRTHDERIDWHSDAGAVVEGGRSVLIDPLPLEEKALEALGTVEAICLTSAGHQRAAWSFRKRFGAKVYAPARAEGLDEEPDATFVDGGALPLGLKAIHAPAIHKAGYALLAKQGGGTLFCGDILVLEGKDLMFVPDKYLEDRSLPRKTARMLLDYNFSILFSAHGDPITSGAKDRIRKLLEADAASHG